jgi:ligand-binding sensor domain-containing protein
MWIATADGLNNYNGHSFKVFRHIQSDSTSLSDNFIQALYEDSSGVLWIGTRDGGLNRFDRKRGVFTALTATPSALGYRLTSNVVTALVGTHDGTLWVGTDRGLNRLRISPFGVLGITHFQHDPHKPHSLGNNSVRALCVDDAGTLWVGTDTGLERFDAQSEHFVHYTLSLDHDHRQHTVYALTHGRDNTGAMRLWVGTDVGLFRYDLSAPASSNHALRQQCTHIHQMHPSQHKPQRYATAIRSLLLDNAGTLWVGTTGSGLLRYDAETQSLEPYSIHHLRSLNLSGTAIYSLAQDRTGLLWVGTYSNGITTFLPRANAFTTYTHDPTNPASTTHLNRYVVSAVCERRNGELWIGTLDGGINRFNRTTGTFSLLHHNDAESSNDPAPSSRTLKRSLPSDGIRCIFEDHTNTVWVATQSGLARYLPRKEAAQAHNVVEVFRHNEFDSTSLSHNNVFTVFEDRQRRLWVGTLGGGLNLFDRERKCFRRFQHNANQPNSLSSNLIRAICQDSTGALWVGTRGGGLNRLNPTTGTAERFFHDERHPRSLSHNAIYTLHVDKRGALWIGTQGGGLNRFNPATQDFTVFRSRAGSFTTSPMTLPNDVIYGIVEDTQGNLWISTNKGVSRITIHQIRASAQADSLSFRNYDVRDGLQSNEFNAGAFHAGHSGRLYFGGICGLNEWFPDSLRDNTTKPPVVITGFQLFGNDVVSNKDLSETDTLMISYKDNYCTFEFAALNFLLPEKNRYRYKLVGFDDTWIEAGARHEASYTNLPHGTYTFLVQGCNNDGIWNERGASVVLVITPPFWQTWWFRLLLWSSLGAAVVGVFVWRVHAVRVAERTSRQMAQLELQSLRLHMNPHFIFNSINSIQYLVSEGDSAAATRYLSTFARLMRKILKHTDYLAVTIGDEIELLTMYMELERLRYDYAFEYRIVCEHRSELASLLIPAMVIQPYVENAIRHGLGLREAHGLVTITLERVVEQHGARLRCVITDNGIGRAKALELKNKASAAEHHLSMATSITQRRLELLNMYTERGSARGTVCKRTPSISVQTTDLTHEDGSAAGTRVEMFLPILDTTHHKAHEHYHSDTHR